MRRCGATESGIQRMLTKASCVAVAMENVGRRQANLLKQEMLAAGGDVAVSHGVCSEEVAATGVVLMGTRRQFESLLARLAEEPFDLPALAGELRAALDACSRRHFEIRMRDRLLAVGPKPAIVGIVNVTPDSFSDGGQFGTPEQAIAHGRQLALEGADVLDVGGESTRPGSDPVSTEEELRRAIPVVEGLAGSVQVPISIDTRHARVAREAVAAGACIINDVTGLRGDRDMARTAAETGAAIVLMHMLGEPRSMQDSPRYDNLMADICRFLRGAIRAARQAGVPDDAIIIDPGIGFGKTLGHNLAILARLGELRTLGRPIMVGPSRKRFIGLLTGIETPAERVCGTAAACAMAVAGGAVLLRVHDVRQMRQALAVAAAVAGAAESVS
jgi:dihydropteroate synthase